MNLERSDSRGGEELRGEMSWIGVVRESLLRRRFGGLMLQERIHHAAEDVATVRYGDLSYRDQYSAHNGGKSRRRTVHSLNWREQRDQRLSLEWHRE